jgi:hypothetical protein
MPVLAFGVACWRHRHVNAEPQTAVVPWQRESPCLARSAVGRKRALNELTSHAVARWPAATTRRIGVTRLDEPATAARLLPRSHAIGYLHRVRE